MKRWFYIFINKSGIGKKYCTFATTYTILYKQQQKNAAFKKDYPSK